MSLRASVNRSPTISVNRFICCQITDSDSRYSASVRDGRLQRDVCSRARDGIPACRSSCETSARKWRLAVRAFCQAIEKPVERCGETPELVIAEHRQPRAGGVARDVLGFRCHPGGGTQRASRDHQAPAAEMISAAGMTIEQRSNDLVAFGRQFAGGRGGHDDESRRDGWRDRGPTARNAPSPATLFQMLSVRWHFEPARCRSW